VVDEPEAVRAVSASPQTLEQDRESPGRGSAAFVGRRDERRHRAPSITMYGRQSVAGLPVSKIVHDVGGGRTV